MHILNFRLAILCVLSITGLSACCSQKVTTQSDITRQLLFGSGGGFSGQVIEYTLLENGQLSRSNSLSQENTSVRTLPQKEVKDYFQQAQQLKLNTLNFKYPGNLYYFLRLKEGDSVQEIIWGDRDHSVPAKVQGLYEALEKAATQ